MITDHGVTRLVEQAEAAAYADMLRAAPHEWRCIDERTPAGWFLCAPTVDVLLFNRLLAAGLDAPLDGQTITSAIERFRAAGVHNFGVPLSPEAAQPAAIELLARAGLVARDAWTKMYRPATDLPDSVPDVLVTVARSEQAAIVARITCAAFGMPPFLEPWIAALVGRDGWRHYLAWFDGEPLASGALYVRGEVGWLGVAGTLQSARRRGAQGALMAARLRDGAALGCRWFVTETGQERPDRPNPSFHNMRRAGFRVAYHRPNYMPQAAPRE